MSDAEAALQRPKAPARRGRRHVPRTCACAAITRPSSRTPSRGIPVDDFSRASSPSAFADLVGAPVSLSSRTLQPLVVLLALQAELVDELRVGLKCVGQLDGERLRVDLRIVDGHLDLKRP